MSCETLTFYSQVGCPKSQSIHLALAANKIPHETVEVSRNSTFHGCKASENGMPLLVKNGEASLKEYHEAIVFLKLIAEDPVMRGKQEKILNDFATYVLPYFDKAVILESPREGMDLFIETLSVLENHLIYTGGRYFGGSQPNVVDYGLFPYLDKVGQWTTTLESKECPRVQTWIKAMQEHPLVTKIMQNASDSKSSENYSACLTQKNKC